MSLPIVSVATFFSASTVCECSGLRCTKLASEPINVRLSAVRKLAAEAADNGLLAPDVAVAIGRVKGAKSAGVRAGNWLTLDQAERLLELPDRSTKKGLRDRALLALLVGCGLRREELAKLKIEGIQQRDGRWCVVDTWGRETACARFRCRPGRRRRIDEWTAAAGYQSGQVLGCVNKGDRSTAQGMNAQSIYEVVEGYGIRNPCRPSSVPNN